MIVNGGERNGPPPTTRSDDDDDDAICRPICFCTTQKTYGIFCLATQSTMAGETTKIKLHVKEQSGRLSFTKNELRRGNNNQKLSECTFLE